MKNLSIMIKPASSLCNLRCKYCFYADIADIREVKSYGIMPIPSMHTMLQRIHDQLSDGDRLTFAFQGGEPTLAGLPWFEEFVNTVKGWEKRIQVSYTLQTNATLLDDGWCRFLAENHFLVGVSWDVLPQCHDETRVDPAGQGTNQLVRQAIKRLSEYRIPYNVLCTLTRQAARHPQKIWKQLEADGIAYVQFTPCLDALEQPNKNPFALTPQRFASFYSQLFPLWLADFRAGRYRSVRLYDDLVNLAAYGVPTSCGIDGRCQPQLVVEADGSVFPCDFYCLEQYRLGSILEDALETLFERSLASPTKVPAALPAQCGSCPYRAFCNGGCKRMRREVFCTGDSACGYRLFLDSCMPQIQQIAREQRAFRR